MYVMVLQYLTENEWLQSVDNLIDGLFYIALFYHWL